MIDIITNYPIISAPTLLNIIPVIAFWYRKSYLHTSLRYLFAFLIIQTVVEWIMLYMAGEGQNNLLLANALVVARYSFISIMFLSYFKNDIYRKTVKILSVVFFIVVWIDGSIVGANQSFKYVEMAECIFVGSYCLLFYSELLIFLPVRYLLKFPFFYVCSGLLIFYFGNLFLSPLSYYLNKLPYNEEMSFFITVPFFLQSVLLIIFSVGILSDD